MSNIKELFELIVADGVITRAEHDEFIDAIHEDGKIDEEENRLFSEMFAMIRDGKIKVVDEEREAYAKKRKEDLKRALEAKTKKV